MLDEFLAHSDTGITDNKIVIGKSASCSTFLCDPDTYCSTWFREFHGIADAIEQNLIQSELIAHNRLIHHVNRINEQYQLFGPNICLNDISDIMNHIRQMAFGRLNPYFSALDPAHIQNIID